MSREKEINSVQRPDINKITTIGKKYIKIYKIALKKVFNNDKIKGTNKLNFPSSEPVGQYYKR